METGVYKITNLINGKIYIGSVAKRNFHFRWQRPYNSYLDSSFKKYGKENFKFEILWLCEPKDCLYFEQLYLDYYEPWIETGKGYNICKIAGSPLGVKRSKETRLLMSQVRIGKKRPLTFGAKISELQINQYRNGRKPAKQKTLQIERIDMITGEIKEYESISSVKHDGFDVSNVVKCCKNRYAFHKGFYWKYLSEN